jgi:hypothetical protein
MRMVEPATHLRSYGQREWRGNPSPSTPASEFRSRALEFALVGLFSVLVATYLLITIRHTWLSIVWSALPAIAGIGFLAQAVRTLRRGHE